MSEWEKVSKTLKLIVKSFPKGSAQFKAIEEAAWAYLFMNMHKSMKEKYKVFRSESNKKLSRVQKQHLREMGIEP